MKRCLTLILLCGCSTAQPGWNSEDSSRYLYAWAGDSDEQDSDFLAVIDAGPGSPTYGQVIHTVPVGLRASMPHHLEYELPARDQLLFANAHHHEQILLFDIADAARPELVKRVPAPPPFRYPHDFARLPNGNVLVGYLRSEGVSPLRGDTTSPGGHGGVAEMDREGRVLRTSSASDPAYAEPIRFYGFAVLSVVILRGRQYEARGDTIVCCNSRGCL